MTVAGFDVGGDVLALGAITGMVYGVLGVGLVLVYRSSRIVNFAHGEIGAFGAAVLGAVTVNTGLPYWLVFAFALCVSAAIGAAADVAIVRRLDGAPVIVSVIATLGLGSVLATVAAIVNSSVGSGITYPQPAGLPSFDLGALRVTPAHSAMLVVTPVVVAALTVFLRRSRQGLAIRAAAANPDAARMAGVLTGRMAAMTWALAGALSAFTAILVLPSRGFSGAGFLGPGLLSRALACAVIARMVNLPVAMVAGVGIGVVERLLLANYPEGGLIEATVFFIILGGLLIQRGRTGRAEDKGTWAVVQAWPPLPDAYRRVFAIRNLSRIVVAAGAVAAAGVPLVTTNATAVVFVVVAAFTLVGLSVGVITGLGGQLSLGQFALAGVGATASHVVTRDGGNFALGVVTAGLAAAAVSLVVGLPALRIRGLMLAVTTLGFALAANAWLFRQSWMLGTGVNTRRPSIGDTTLDTGKRYYYVALAVLLVGLWLAGNVWRGGLGRRLRAVRDNEDAARAFTVAATSVKLQGFLVSGFLAGLGGAVYGHLLSRISASTFEVTASIAAAAAAVVGGLGVLAAPLLGTLYIVGVPEFLPLDNAGLAATSAGWLVLILNFPGGIAQAFGPLRARVVDWLARRAGVEPDAQDERAPLETRALLPPGRPARPATGDVVLAATGIAKSFGGVAAVAGVDLTVTRGETVGLIGPNGAGKTTLFEVLSGFTRPDAGTTVFDGVDVSRFPPERRGRMGLIRSFQDAGLFPTMTVTDVVMVSLERLHPTRFAAAVAGLPASERRKAAQSRDLITMMGLQGYRHHQVRELSTGTRRIVELTCLMALDPTLLLLDEPSSGIAQRETEALGGVLVRIREQLGLTLLIIEHDIPLVTSIADRIVAMEAGRIVASGPPDVVVRDPAVVAAYLGTDHLVIERSDRAASVS